MIYNKYVAINIDTYLYVYINYIKNKPYDILAFKLNVVTVLSIYKLHKSFV